MIKKKKKKYDIIVLLAKTKLNRAKVFIFKVLIDSNINRDGFISINNALNEWYETRNQKFKDFIS